MCENLCRNEHIRTQSHRGLSAEETKKHLKKSTKEKPIHEKPTVIQFFFVIYVKVNLNTTSNLIVSVCYTIEKEFSTCIRYCLYCCALKFVWMTPMGIIPLAMSGVAPFTRVFHSFRQKKAQKIVCFIQGFLTVYSRKIRDLCSVILFYNTKTNVPFIDTTSLTGLQTQI